MYVDKPMRGHGLMQAIARVNRVFKDKPAGLVVDYIGIGQNLKKALGDYSASDQNGRAPPQLNSSQSGHCANLSRARFEPVSRNTVFDAGRGQAAAGCGALWRV